MITVKNITQYTVAPTVAKSQNTVALLSRLKEFSTLDNFRVFVTRNYWAKELGVNRKTIQRWEDEIINPNPKFAYLYYDGKDRIGKSGLDFYQRFFLSLVYSLKEGKVTGAPLTNQGVADYLEEIDTNRQPRWMNLNRKEFFNSNRQHTQKKAS